MENQLQVFDFEGSNVRTVNIDGNPYFVGKDVATILGYKNTKDALLKHVDDEDKLGSQIATSGQNREMKVINESGLYSLILSSKLPSAKKFKRWVTSEVLPAIRKTGAYQAKPKDNYQIPATYGEALQLAATLQTKIEHDAPSLKYFHDQMRNPGLMTTTEIAKDYGWSARKLNKYLESKGVIYR
ncbi:BRO family protein, partial [Limosilactobacillus fermentum]